jgi:hypothetical protein
MITPNRYSVQFTEGGWDFCTVLVTDDLQRAKKFCAAMVAFNPSVEKGRVIDPNKAPILSECMVYSVDSEREAVKQLRTLLEVG